MTPDTISEAEAANELMRLAKVIARHNRLYHTEDSPEISDADYDALIRRNAELEAQFPHLIREDSPSRQVGAAIESTPLRKVTHELRLYSLDNGFSDEDIAERSEEHTSELQSLMRISYAVFCLKKKKTNNNNEKKH